MGNRQIIRLKLAWGIVIGLTLGGVSLNSINGSAQVSDPSNLSNRAGSADSAPRSTQLQKPRDQDGLGWSPHDETQPTSELSEELKRIIGQTTRPQSFETFVTDDFELNEARALKQRFLKELNALTQKTHDPVLSTQIPTSGALCPVTQNKSQVSASVSDLFNQLVEVLSHAPGTSGQARLSDSSAPKYLLLKNSTGHDGIPRNFRTTLGISSSHEGESKLSSKDRDQLATLSMSGSGQVSADELEHLAQTVYKNKKVYVIDLRLENHVFVNNQSFSQHGNFNGLNWGKTQAQVVFGEHQFAQSLDEQERIEFSIAPKKVPGQKKPGDVSKWKITKGVLAKDKVLTERQIISEVNNKLAGSSLTTQYVYKRLANPDLHRPRDSQVDQFIKFVMDARASNSPTGPDPVFHFHCAAGRGRTTTAMSMLDMMSTYDRAGVDEIIARQHKLGGSNLVTDSKKKMEPEARAWAMERQDFVHHFYRYCKQAGAGGFKMSWSEWLETHPEARAKTNH